MEQQKSEQTKTLDTNDILNFGWVDKGSFCYGKINYFTHHAISAVLCIDFKTKEAIFISQREWATAKSSRSLWNNKAKFVINIENLINLTTQIKAD